MKGTELTAAREMLGLSTKNLADLFRIAEEAVTAMERQPFVDTRTELSVRFLVLKRGNWPPSGIQYKQADGERIVRLLPETVTVMGPAGATRTIRWFMLPAGVIVEAWEDDFLTRFAPMADDGVAPQEGGGGAAHTE